MKKIISRLFMFFFITALITRVTFAQPFALQPDTHTKVLLIIANASVEKYRDAEAGFMQRYKGKVLRIDLGDKKSWTYRRVKSFLYREYPDIIYTIGSKAYLIANQLISEKTILFSSIVNWQRLPNIHAKNRYGISNELHSGMQLSLIRQLLPQVDKIGLLYSDKYTRHLYNEMQMNAKLTGHNILSLVIDNNQWQAGKKVESLLQQVDILLLPSDPLLMKEKQQTINIIQAGIKSNTAIVGYFDAIVENSGMLSLSVDATTIGRQVAGLLKRLIEGKTPKKKIGYPAGSDLTLNIKTLKQLQLPFNQQALFMFNRTIE